MALILAAVAELLGGILYDAEPEDDEEEIEAWLSKRWAHREWSRRQ